MDKQYSLTTELFPLLNRHFVGVDRLLDQVQRVKSTTELNYPPYNIVKHDDTHYSVELAVAGFSPDEIDIEVRDGQLVISGEKKSELEVQYLHRGISQRSFARSFTLGEDIVVNSARYENGLLIVDAERIIPEEKKPKKIAITKA